MKKVTLVFVDNFSKSDEEKYIDVDTVPCVNDVIYFDHTDFVVSRRVYQLEEDAWRLYLKLESHQKIQGDKT